MKFGSVCSGIEAASAAWNPLGWKAQWLAEIEPFPCSVLKHHYPDTPNLGDMTKFNDWPTDDKHAIDLLCGGTPCQSFSVAGLRKGLDDPRGNLMLTFGAIAAKYKPKWIMWENVPGVVSSNGGQDFTSFLDMLEELGYICDIEILDAQYFGVAQRRRRVFVCGQHRDDLLSQKTDSSALTITQCLQEILQAILTEGCSKLGNAPGSSALPIHSRDGATRRMRLFGLVGESECWPTLRENLIAAFQRSQQGQKQSGAPLGESEKELTPAGQLTGLSAENLFTLTEPSLKNALDEAFEVMKLFTTSTPTSPITQAQIYTCSKAALLIAKLTLLLSQSSPAFWNSALSSLTAIEEYTNYARSTNSDLFGDVERFQAWSDFIEQAEHTNDALLDIGIECAGEIFPLPDCLQGHPAPRRQAGQAITPTIRAGASNGGAGHGARSGDSKDELIVPVCAEVGMTLTSGGNGARGRMDPVNTDLILSQVGTLCAATGQAGAEICAEMAPTLNCNHEAPYAMYQTAHTLRGEGFDASEDGTGRGTPLVPVTVPKLVSNGDVHSGFRDEHGLIAFQPGNLIRGCGSAPNSEVFPTLAASHGRGASNQDPHVAIAVSLRGREGGATAELGDEVGNCLRASGGGGDKAHVLASMQVRRLTPGECESLQGFQQGYTAVPHRGKPAADGPRYKALGNSWAVPNVRWIGERIDAVALINQVQAAMKQIAELEAA